MGDSCLDTYLSKLEEVFMELVRRLHNELAGQMVSGITGSQFFVLKKISARGRLTVSEVAEELGVSLSAVTALVDRLVKNGLAVRSRDERDRRLVWLEATSKGKRVLDKCIDGRRKVSVKFFGQLPEGDLEKLVEIYEKVLSRIKAEEKSGEV